MVNVPKSSISEQAAQNAFKNSNTGVSIPRIRDLALLTQILKSQGMGRLKKDCKTEDLKSPELTLADLLSTESIPRSDLESFVDNLLKGLLKKEF